MCMAQQNKWVEHFCGGYVKELAIKYIWVEKLVINMQTLKSGQYLNRYEFDEYNRSGFTVHVFEMI